VLWYLEVRGTPTGRADFTRRFPLVVYPALTTQTVSRGLLSDGAIARQVSAS
jgi:hypothetical protein